MYGMAAEAQAQIDDEITKHILLVCNLRRRRNMFSPIFRLPPEILEIIFLHGARDHHENSNTTLCMPSWVNVSYVCCHWRNVALNCQTLWSYHFTVSLRWTEELLSRSNHASLKIRIFQYKGNPLRLSSIVKKLMNHMERVQELRLHLPAQHLPAMLSLRAPRLQYLEVIVIQGFPSNCTRALFNGDTPALRTLELSDYGAPWHSLALGRLTTLSLRGVPPRFQQNMVDFLAVLGCMQDLVFLHLEDALPSARSFLSTGEFNAFRKIDLPCLTQLSVVAPLSAVVAVLSCTDIPLKTEMRLEFQSEYDSSIEDYSAISRLLARRFTTSRYLVPSIRSLVIQSTSCALKFILSTSERDCDSRFSKSYEGSGRNIPLRLSIAADQAMMKDNRDRIISDICCSIPSTNVRSLHVVYPPFSPAFWRKTLAHFERLQYIKLSQGYMPDLATVLRGPAAHVEDSNGYDANERHPTDCAVSPALEELELYCITFSTRLNPSGLGISKKMFLDALSTRKVLLNRLTTVLCDGEHDELLLVANADRS